MFLINQKVLIHVSPSFFFFTFVLHIDANDAVQLLFLIIKLNFQMENFPF